MKIGAGEYYLDDTLVVSFASGSNYISDMLTVHIAQIETDNPSKLRVKPVIYMCCKRGSSVILVLFASGSSFCFRTEFISRL